MTSNGTDISEAETFFIKPLATSTLMCSNEHPQTKIEMSPFTSTGDAIKSIH